MALRSRPGRESKKAFAALAAALLVILVVVVVAAACGGGTSSSTTSGPATTSAGGAQVVMKGFAFNPASITIKAGESVTWTNQDGSTHNVTADGKVFDSSDIAPGASYTFTFANAGTYTYTCTIHPNMKGTVIVQ